MSSAIDPAKLKVVELRNELQERGLDTKGNKAALVQRLKEALEKETNTTIPNTSILETSTEDLDSSQNEEPEETSKTKSSEKEMDVDGKGKPEIIVKLDKPSTPASKPTEKESTLTTSKSPEAKTTVKTDGKAESEETSENGDQAEETGKDDDASESQENDKPKEKTEESAEKKGEKRKRDGDSPDREGSQKVRAKSPIKEDEPTIDSENVQLNWYDSDLHLQVNKDNFLSAKPFTEGAFGYAWAGARASHGVSKGKVCYEVKITEEIKWEDLTKIAERRQESRRNQKRDRDKRGKKIDDKKGDDKKSDKPSDDKEKATSEEKPEEKKDSTENGDNNKDDGTADTKAETTEKKEEPEKMDTSTTEESKPADETPMETEAAAAGEDAKKSEEAEKKEGDVKEGESKEGEKTEEEEEKKEPEEPVLIHLVRVGWSVLTSSLQLGEDKCSYAYESTGKFVNDKQFIDYGKTFAVGDVVGAFLNIDDEYVTIRYSVNGELQPVAATLQTSEFPENFALFPHVLTRNCAFEINLGQKEEPWFPAPDLMKDYVFLTEADDKITGPTRPETRSDCEVILMCGLPGSGKTHWVREHCGTNTDKRYTVIGNSSLLERMTVAGNPLRSKFKGKWSIFVDRLQKCLNALITLASQRRRNYIIDQTNVFPSAQRRKMRPFEGFKRKAVIVVVGDEEQTKRQAMQESIDGKGVPDSVILEMKAAMTLPEKSDWMDEIIFVGMDEDGTKEQVKKYNEVGKSAGYGTEKRFRGDRFRGGRRNDFRGKSGRDRNFRDRRFDRRGGGKFGPRGGGGGGGWRDRQERRGPPPSRDYRGGGGRDYGSRDYGRRDSGGFNRSRNNDRSGGGGGRWSSGGGGRSSGAWSSGGGGGGAWSQQSYGGGGGYSNWNQGGGGGGGGGQWKYGGGGGQQSYGGYGGGGRQGGGGPWDYYGQYNSNQNWNSHK